MFLNCAFFLFGTESESHSFLKLFQATKLIKDLEKQSESLESERDNLQAESSLKKSELLSLILDVPAELRKKVTENIRDMK